MTVHAINHYPRVIDEICGLNWSSLTRDELMAACCAYSYFSEQFVEAVDIACELYPSDQQAHRASRGRMRHRQSVSLSRHSQRGGENEP